MHNWNATCTHALQNEFYGIGVCITNAGNRGNVTYLIIYSSVMWQLNCYFKQHFNLAFVYRNNKRLRFPVTSTFSLPESFARSSNFALKIWPSRDCNTVLQTFHCRIIFSTLIKVAFKFSLGLRKFFRYVTRSCSVVLLCIGSLIIAQAEDLS